MLDNEHWHDLHAGALFFAARDAAIALLDHFAPWHQKLRRETVGLGLGIRCRCTVHDAEKTMESKFATSWVYSRFA